MKLFKLIFYLFATSSVVKGITCEEAVEDATDIYCKACDKYTPTSVCFSLLSTHSLPTHISRSQCAVEENGKKHCSQSAVWKNGQEYVFSHLHRHYFANTSMCEKAFEGKGKAYALCFRKVATVLGFLIIGVLVVFAILVWGEILTRKKQET